MNSPGHSEHCRCCTCSNTLVDGRTPLIHLCDVTFMREKRTILSDINLTVDKGDFVAITGPNGGVKLPCSDLYSACSNLPMEK